jgi:hypothetical protein
LPIILSEDEELEMCEYYDNVDISFWRNIVLNGQIIETNYGIENAATIQRIYKHH